MRNQRRSGALTRRQALGLLSSAAAGVALSGCKVVTSQAPARTAPELTKQISIPKSGARLPTGQITLNWMDSGDLKAPYEEAVFSAYEKEHPNIKIAYNGTSWTEIDQSIPLAVRDGNPPDIFAIPENVPVQVAINGGWVAPIENLIPNFKTWQAAFPSTAFVPGVDVFDGHVYTWPTSSMRRYSYMLMYDTGYLQQAGHDPARHRFTWDSFRAACKTITRQGKGQYYGLMSNGQQVGDLALELAQLAGAHGAAFNWKTGTFNYTQPEVEGAFELLLALKSDGSIFPGFLSLGDADSRARMPQRVAAMMFDGPWDIPAWPAANPSYDFGIALPPTGNDGRWQPSSYQETGANQVYIAADSKYKEVAADLFSYMGSLAGQTHMVVISGGNLTSEMPEANARADRSKLLDPRARTGADIATNLMRVAPMVQVRNPATAEVILEQAPVTPDIVDVGQGILSGQLQVKSALRSLQERSEANLDQAIKAAQAKGAKVQRSDWVFSNWNPERDYTKGDYAALS